MEITPEQLEQLAEIIQSCDNNLHATKLPVSPTIHVEGLTHGLRETRDQLLELHEAIAGEPYPHLVSG